MPLVRDNNLLPWPVPRRQAGAHAQAECSSLREHGALQAKVGGLAARRTEMAEAQRDEGRADTARLQGELERLQGMYARAVEQSGVLAQRQQVCTCRHTALP